MLHSIVSTSDFPLLVGAADFLETSSLFTSAFWKNWIDKNLIDLGFQIASKLLWAILILVLTRFSIQFVGRILHRTLRPTEPTLRKFLIQGAEVLILLVGVVAFLDTVGIQATSVVAVIGAAGLAVGLALQNTLSQFAAGVLLISLRPFEVGDFIEVTGVTGTVDSIGIFSANLVTPDNIRITIPNSTLFSSTLKNKTVLGTRRVDLEIDIGDRAIEPTIIHLLSLVQPHPLVLNEPKITCHVASVSATATILYLRPWCSAEVYEQVQAEVQQIVKEALQGESSPIVG